MREYSYQTGKTHIFTVVDYVLFVAILIVSAGIGIFYAIKDRRKQTTKEYLLAGGNMHVIPVALSLLASFMSAITILGTPSEMYSYGTMYLWIAVSYIFAVFFAAHIYIPVFYRLGVTSSYEYLELRFGSVARIAGAITYITQMTIYMACVLYAPSLALNAVTGFTLWGSIWGVGLVCTFYTALGGMKAVLWTDSFQVIMMIVGLVAIIIQGSIEVGGFAHAWEISAASGRIYFTDFSPDPSVRHSVWSLVIGGAFLWTYIYGTNQAQVQRAVTCPTLKKAQIAMWINMPGLVVMLILSAMTGILAYAFYEHCDPKSFGLISAGDQLLPLFVMDVLGHVKGIPGLFVACLFSGALSTISSGLNSISAVVLQDVVRKIFFPNMTERTATITSKCLGIAFGLACIGLTYIASLLGGILQAALALYGMIGGPILGIFTLGMLFPWANQWGAVAGLVSSLVLMFWIGVGFQIKKPVIVVLSSFSVRHCNWNLTSPTTITSEVNRTSMAVTTTIMTKLLNGSISNADHDKSLVTELYTLSYMWYTATAVLTVVVVGLIVSFITGHNTPSNSDPHLFCPIFDVIFPWLPEKILKPLRFGVDYSKLRRTDRNLKQHEDVTEANNDKVNLATTPKTYFGENKEYDTAETDTSGISENEQTKTKPSTMMNQSFSMESMDLNKEMESTHL
ncbi:sodium-coupled monocarboxylate transporter 2-like [Gigantopelta aegis]|uniref:sodium-coupled monocarboxylate transporter 2-like n=1 Tax=Gigantopelta aegis TaxID=1735272 RepID=UPI001B88D56F|nr:sodium-coupled monocarboxylate transporter 2-like [Gigantopelta aegis]